MKVPLGTFVLPVSYFFILQILKMASANSPSRWLRTKKFFGQGIDGLGAHAAEADAELEVVVVVFPRRY